MMQGAAPAREDCFNDETNGKNAVLMFCIGVKMAVSQNSHAIALKESRDVSGKRMPTFS